MLSHLAEDYRIGLFLKKRSDVRRCLGRKEIYQFFPWTNGVTSLVDAVCAAKTSARYEEMPREAEQKAIDEAKKAGPGMEVQRASAADLGTTSLS